MTVSRNLADPEFEPTDAELTELSIRAFAGIRAEHERALQELRLRIAAARRDVLRDLAERSAGAQGSS
jgi:hypothetical protein